MLKRIVGLKVVFMLLFGLVFIAPSVFAQAHHNEQNYRNGGGIHRSSGGQRNLNNRGSRHYYHDGNWNRNGWYGWGVHIPMFTEGVLVTSLPPDAVPVVVSGNAYFYGNNTYFRQVSSGGFAVVTLIN